MSSIKDTPLKIAFSSMAHLVGHMSSECEAVVIGPVVKEDDGHYCTFAVHSDYRVNEAWVLLENAERCGMFTEALRGVFSTVIVCNTEAAFNSERDRLWPKTPALKVA